MRAVALNEYGGPEVLEVVDLPEPKVGPDVVLRIHLHETCPMEQAAEAHRLVEGGQVHGKVVLTFRGA